jgi:tRNA 5-methylaminomethyl-2-thiouridine biosynthesis bifunctional protein
MGERHATAASSVVNKPTPPMGHIENADLDWITDEHGERPMSRRFGDVYFSREDGLAETRHVFLQGNQLSERLAALTPYQPFIVGETGFGTGLNVLALWQLWRQVRPDNHSRLHVITVEKFPLRADDLARALRAWPELADLSAALLAQYPPALAGPHRLIFTQDRFSIDLWLGDAADCLPRIYSEKPVDVWFLDGFAPACNPDIWHSHILAHMVRLSGIGTTFASFSVAGLVKRGLREHGMTVTRSKGFGKKGQMMRAWWPNPQDTPSPLSALSAPTPLSNWKTLAPQPQRIGVIGAGIAGLSVAHALAQRGYSVQLFDAVAPLAGASGNLRALLTPKFAALSQVSEHLPTLGWLSTLRWWAVWQHHHVVLEPTGALTLATAKLPLARHKLTDYPQDVAQPLSAEHASAQAGVPITTEAVSIAKAALLNPAALRDVVLSSPLIHYQHAQITQLQRDDATGTWRLLNDQQHTIDHADHVIVTCARQTTALCAGLPTLNSIRGQVSWMPKPALVPQQPLNYGGYCASVGDQLLLGASFVRQDTQTDIRPTEHAHLLELITDILPDVAAQLPPIATWQGRASTRAQTRDYLPVVGAVPQMHGVWTLCGLGSKGFAFAPLCAELLAAQLLGECWPVSGRLGQSLRPDRP